MSLSNKQKQYISNNKHKKASDLADKLNLTTEEVQAYLDEIQDAPDPSTLSTGKKAVFSAILILIPFLFFGALEIGLRLGDYKGNTDLFIQPEELDGKYLFPNPNFASRYFFNTSTIPNPSRDPFLTEKPEDGFRVFAIGGSSAAAFPYGFNVLFSRVVEDVLTDAMPNRTVEVVNTGISAVNSFTLYDEMDEILEHQPDAIMIYAGHNEYYGALGVGSSETLGQHPGFVRFYLGIQRLRTFMLLRDWYIKTMRFFASPGENGASGKTLMSKVVREQNIPLDSDLYKAGVDQYRSNLREILSITDEHDIPVFLGTLSSNLKDHKPFVSIETDKHPAAQEIYTKGRNAYYGEQNFDKALEHFTYARDLDALRFRAPSEMNDVIRDLAEEFDVSLVDVQQTFAEASPNGIVGENIMLEHLHPNMHGYFLMGKAFAEEALSYEPWQEKLSDKYIRPWPDYKARRYVTQLDSLIGHHRIRLLELAWPFVPLSEQPDRPPAYNPYSFTDSLAYEVVNGDLTWERAKVQQAQYFQDRNMPMRALSEYYGVIRDIPYNDSAAKIAARILMNNNMYLEAKSVLLKAYEIKPSNFTTRMLGSIEVNFKNYDKGIAYLEEALGFNPQDQQALYNISGAHALKGEYQKAKEYAKELQKLNPRYPGLQNWMQQLNRALQQQKSTDSN